MSVNTRSSESKFLRRARIALINVESHSEIKTALGEYGMKEAWVEEGWQILNRAKVTCELNKKKASETRRASNAYSAKYKEVEKLFKRHYQLTRMLYKKDPATLEKLGITGRFPRGHIEFFDKVKQFYQF